MSFRDGIKIFGTLVVIAIVLWALALGFKNREKPVPYQPRPARREVTERKPRTRRRPQINVVQETAQTNAAAEETISMRELKHERAVMFVPEGDPIPGFDTKGLVEDTLTAFRGGADKEKKMKLMYDIAVIGDKMVMPAILAALDDKDPDIRTLAVEAMKAIDDPAIIEGVEKALRDSDPDLREEALECVAILTPEPGLNDIIMQALNDPEESVRENALDMLTMLVDDCMMPSLDYALKNGDADTQETALSLLEQLHDGGSHNALQPIIEQGLLSEFNEVRQMAVSILQTQTGQDLTTYEQWVKWYEENRK
ncbi:HEAT repeat domain-containing protein [bacterium]|nr:HEAT repeat domain-containing protein [bacterium]